MPSDETDAPSDDQRKAFGIWGYLFFFLWAIALAIVAQGSRVILVLASAIIFSLFFCEDAFREMHRWRFWLLIASALLISPLAIGERDISLLGIWVSREGFWTGLWMALRAITIALAANAFASLVSVAEMAQLLEKVGLKGLGFAIGVALNMLPAIREAAGNNFNAMKLRGGFRRHRFKALKMLFVAIIVNSLQHADQVVDAAEMRAFSVEGCELSPHMGTESLDAEQGESSQGHSYDPIPFTLPDLTLIVVLLVVGMAILRF